MRVTNKMLSNNFLRDMNNNLENMQTLQQQMSSGKEIRKPSDNPFKAARAMQLNTDINANKQYNENISDTVNWLDTTDTALGQAGNVLQRVRELLVSSGNAAYGPDEKTAIKDEINEKVGELSQILNTNFDGKYVFGGTRGTTKPTSTVTDSSGNTALIYNKKETKVQVSDSSLWAGTSIGFNLDGTDYTVNVSSPLPGSGSVNDIVDNINSQINNVPELKGKLQASMETNETKTYIKFTSLTDGDIKMQKPASGSIPTDLSSVVGTSGITLGNDQVNMIKSSLSVEISQGVSIDYNVNAGNIMNFTSEGGKTYSLSSLLSDITNHLSGKLSTTDPAGSDPANLLNNQDLAGITDTINNLLKLRSEVGAKQNRMESAQGRNEEENNNMTELLSKTEDIDITQKTMEYANAQTVYMAALQTSAKVIQPSLMDYLR